MANYQDTINGIMGGIKSLVEELQVANQADGVRIRDIRKGINERTDLLEQFAEGLHECADVMDTIVDINDDVDFYGDDDYIGYDEAYQIHLEQLEDEMYADDGEDDGDEPVSEPVESTPQE